MSYKGPYKPNNVQKYKGNPTEVYYRSLWELKCMRKFDASDAIEEWSSEEIAIPYYCPIKKRWRRYFPDFYIKAKNSKGELTEYIIEVKPFKETKKPVPPKDGRKRRRYLSEARKYINNTSKWDAAEEYCADRKWTFQVWTEKSMNF